MTERKNAPALDSQRAFEESIKERLRKDIGGLIPDAVLAQLVEKAIQGMFFTRRERKGGGYYDRTQILPSWFKEEVQKTPKSQIDGCVKNYFASHGDAIAHAVEKELVAHAPGLLAELLIGCFSAKVEKTKYAVEQSF